ncbi:unnamed protein product [Paramecium primaurelia]|uniref:TLDc domain-containing protein n=1 Tax=Paramecium primaurelia TaxID=5886 RepID=A0A8S1KF00_PARPR|nr:unnamed protein product [Paramecium primaurelia]
MEQVQAYNENLHLPYQQLPTKKQKKIKIYCQEYGHRDQKVEYISLTPESDVVKSRLQCIKCINGPYSHFRQDVAILKEILSDSLNVLKNTQFQGNLCQEFSNLYHYLNLDVTKDDIEFKFATLKKEIVYQIEECKKEVLKSYDEYYQIKEKIEISDFREIFNFEDLKKELYKYAQKGPNPSPRDQKQINDQLNEYVKKLHAKEQDKQQERLQTQFEKFKKKVNEFTQKNCFHYYKIDQGMESIQKIIKEMKTTFSQNLFTQSELSNDFITDVLTTINQKVYSETSNVEKITPIYSSIHEGLNYKIMLEKLKGEGKSDLLFIFKSSNSQRFGAYIASDNSSGNLRTTNPPLPQPMNRATPLVNQRSFLFSLSKKEIYPIKQGATSLNINQAANDNSELLNFGNNDLNIKSTFKQCKSQLNSGFNTSNYQIGNYEMHLANALEFEIIALQIFKIPQETQK